MAPPENRFFDKHWVPANSHAGQPGVQAAPYADPVARMSNMGKLQRTLEYARSASGLSDEIRRALGELLSPESLEIAAGVMAFWAASHFFGVGEVVDVALVGVTEVMLGAQAIQGLADLAECGHDIMKAKSDFELRLAATKLVRAFVLLGVAALMALLLRKAEIKRVSQSEAPLSGGAGPKASVPPRTVEPPAVEHPKQQGFVGKLAGNPVELPGVKTQKITYVKRDRTLFNQLRAKFDSTVRRDFCKSLANSPENVAQLEKAGLTESEIASLRDGSPPEGYQVHHKLPLDDGGTNDFSNLVLIKNDPFHKALTNEQRALVGKLMPGESKVVDFPVIDGVIYPP